MIIRNFIVFFITTKSEVADCLRKFVKEVKTAGNVTKVLLSDGGKEFNCEAVQKVMEEHGITHRLTMPYAPEQNGAAEQENRTVVESARSMVHARWVKRMSIEFGYPTKGKLC
jgi:transposase InsO family protein